MLMRKLVFTLFAALLLTACGKQYQAERAVSRFMSDNMVNPDQVESRQYSDLDSTRYLNDSIVESLRQQARHSDLYRPQPAYDRQPVKRMLYFTHVSFKMGDREYRQTYYLSEDLSGVVAFR